MTKLTEIIEEVSKNSEEFAKGNHPMDAETQKRYLAFYTRLKGDVDRVYKLSDLVDEILPDWEEVEELEAVFGKKTVRIFQAAWRWSDLCVEAIRMIEAGFYPRFEDDPGFIDPVLKYDQNCSDWILQMEKDGDCSFKDHAKDILDGSWLPPIKYLGGSDGDPASSAIYLSLNYLVGPQSVSDLLKYHSKEAK